MPTDQRRNTSTTVKMSLAHHCQVHAPDLKAEGSFQIKNTLNPAIEKILTNLLIHYPYLSSKTLTETRYDYLFRNLKILLDSFSDQLKIEFTSGKEVNEEASYVETLDEKMQLDPESQVVKIYGFSAQVISVYNFLTDKELANLHPALSMSILTHLSTAAKESFPMLFFKGAEELMENSYWYGDKEFFQEEIREQAAQYEDINIDLLTEAQLKDYCESEGIISPQLWYEYLFEEFPQFKEDILTLQEINTLLKNYSLDNKSKLLEIISSIENLKNLDKEIQECFPKSQNDLLDLCFPSRASFSFILEPKRLGNYPSNELGFFQEPLLDDETRRMESSLPDCPAFMSYLNTDKEGERILKLLACADKICIESEKTIGILETWMKPQ